MVGKQQIQITGNEFAGGLATSDYLGDGGIGTSSQNLNPIISQGAIYATANASETGLSHSLVASCEDYENPTSTNCWMADAGSTLYYQDNAGVIHFGLSGGGSWQLGTTDMVPFTDGAGGVALYISAVSDISRLTGSIGTGLGLGDAWWSVTKGQGALVNGVPHPMLVYQNILWIADGQNLHNMTAGGTVTKNVLTLDTNETINSLGIDPGTGLMMIGIHSNTGGGGIYPSRNFISLYDGYSAKVRRKVPVQGNVYSFTTVGSQIFVGIDNSIGIWNGLGVTFLRRLTEDYLPYKHRVVSANNLLCIADGKNVLIYGDIQNGKRVWFPYFTNTENSNTVNTIYKLAYNRLCVNYDGSKVKMTYLLDTNLGPGTGVLQTNNINFPRPVFIRNIRVFTTGIPTTAGVGSVSIVDENNVTTTPTVNKFVVASGPKYWFDFPFEKKLMTLQPKITLDTETFGIVKIVIYYDTAE